MCALLLSSAVGARPGVLGLSHSSRPRRSAAALAARPWTGAGRQQAPSSRRILPVVLSSRLVVFAADEVEDAILELEMDAEDRMDKAITNVKNSFSTVRTGRASPNMLDRIEVDYYGAMTSLKSLAGVSTPDAQTLQIQPFDQGALAAIERAIFSSDLGLTPNNDGKIIRLRIPELTADRRKEMAKKVNALGEDGKVAVRNVRRDILKSLGKVDGISEDAKKGMEDRVQKMTDKTIKQIDDLIAAKSKDLTTL